MNRIDYNSSMAPILDSLFDKFSKTGTLNYCIICLRTERRLVQNRAFKKFTSSMKLDKKRWQHHQICYMCERQATNALKFLNAATFAAAIDTIFSEIIQEKRRNNVNVFQDDIFNAILNKFGLDRYKMSPLEWDLDLEAIRKSSQLIETQPLVIDNLNNNTLKTVSVQHPAAPEELYVIPDDPPASLGHVTGLASRCPAETHQDKQDTMQNILRSPTPNVDNTNDDTFMLGSSDPNISETLVILDDDEEKDPLQIRINNVISTAVPQPPSTPIFMNMLPTPNEAPTLAAPPKLPILVPLESLLEKPKEIYTGDGLLIGNPGGNYTLHPIAIKEGVTTVPSLEAKLINGQLVYDKLPYLPLIVNQLNNSIDNSPKDVLPQIDDVSTLQTNSEDNSKTTKRDSPDVAKCTTPNKMAKGLPVEEKSDSDKSRIDWEDKIPMDVISYVDALDPNRDPRMCANRGRGRQRGRGSSYIVQTTTNSPCPSDVIDLC